MDYFFKNRKEVEQFFKEEYFSFKFISDNTIHFETLRPIILGGNLFNFCLSFYFEDGYCFFNYSSFNDWLDQFQLCEVIKICESTNEREVLFFSKYEKN